MTAFGAWLRRLAGGGAMLCLALAAAAQDLAAAEQALAARFPAPATRYETPGVQPGRDSFTSNDELRQALRGLAALAQGPRLLAVGRSGADVAIEALHFTRAPGRPAVLLVGQQHGDEPAGAEALLAVAQWLATPEAAPLLERVDVLVLPRANPDGAALGLRWGQHGLDINRDHLLLRTPEARAIALLVRDYRPLVVADLHEYPVRPAYQERFNALPRNDLLLQYATTANLPPQLSLTAEAVLREPLLRELESARLRADWYHTHPEAAAERRLSMGSPQPDTLRNVQGLRHAFSFLLETRGLGLGRTHLQRRVHAHVVAVKSLLRSAAGQADALQAVRQQVDAQVAGMACRGDVVVLATPTPTRRDMLMLDPATGADKWVPVLWENALDLEAVVRRTRPCGYWLSADAETALHGLRELGVTVQRLQTAGEWPAEQWHETARRSTARPDARGGVDDGLGLRLVQVDTMAVTLAAAPGSWWVPLDQPLANLVVAALEPDTPFGWYAHRVLPGLGSAARVMAWPPGLEPVPAGLPPPRPAPTAASAASAASAAAASGRPTFTEANRPPP